MQQRRGITRLLATVIAIIYLCLLQLAIISFDNDQGRYAEEHPHSGTEMKSRCASEKLAQAETDINLRSGPSSAARRIGIAERGTQVQVINVSTDGQWFEVNVLLRGRPKENPLSSDSGWLNSKLVRLQNTLDEAVNIRDKETSSPVLRFLILLVLFYATWLIGGRVLRGPTFQHNRGESIGNLSLALYLLKLLLLFDEEQENIIGDLFEEYSQLQPKAKARIWLYKQILKSMPYLIYKSLKNCLASLLSTQK
jgi:hypothetical protein